MIASPGNTSLSSSKPKAINAALSEEKALSWKPFTFLTPIHSGLIPFGSLNAITPQPVIEETTL